MRVPPRERRFLNGTMVPDSYVELVRIADVKYEQVGDEKRFCLYFDGHHKALSLNRSNLTALVGLFGDETDRWLGQRIELYAVATSYQGKPVRGIRLRPAPQRQAEIPPGPRPVAREPGDDDEPITHTAIRW